MSAGAAELGKFADPFLLPSRENIPLQMTTAMDFCKFLYHETPMYRTVVKRTVGHFVTELDYRGEVGSPKEREEFSQFFNEELGALQEMRLLGEEHGAYGNGFLRIFFPFVRTLIDRRHNLGLYTLSMFPEELVKFDLRTQTYSVPDPLRSDLAVDKRPLVELTIRDTPGKDFSKIRLARLDPKYVRLRHATWSGSTQVQYTFPPEMQSRIRKGNLFEVNRTPADVLRCVAEKQDYLFDEDAVFHLKNPTIMGVSNDGWGLPEILAHYPTIHKIAVYDRIDESIGHDYLLPLRIITPDLAGMSDSHRMGTIATEWTTAVDRMVKEQRLDRTQVNGFPFACKLLSLGGEGKSLVPKDLKEFEVRQLLDGMGYPEELIRGSFTSQQLPAAIRMFESAFYPLSQGLRNATKFAVGKISRYMFGEAYDAVLGSPRVADDIDRRGLIFNLYSSGDIDRATAFAGLGLDQPAKLKVRRAKEDLEIQEELRQLEEDAERRAQLGSLDEALDAAGAEGGQPSGGGGGAPVTTPTDLRANAEQIAQQWLAIPHDGQRAQAMQQVRASDPDLYAVAKDLMEQQRRQGASQGRAQVAAQAQQQPATTA